MGNAYKALLPKYPIVDTEFEQMYKWLTAMPADFDPRDKERIKIFSERLTAARLAVTERLKTEGHYQDPLMCGPRYCFVQTQKEAADWIGVTPQRISQYEKGNISAIPVQHLLAFYDMYNVTPHYLLGYTSKPDRFLRFAEDGSVMCNKDGKPIESFYPLEHPVLSQKNSIHILSMLASQDTKRFLTLCKFLNSSDQTLKTGFDILDVLIQNEQLEQEKQKKKQKEQVPSK